MTFRTRGLFCALATAAWCGACATGTELTDESGTGGQTSMARGDAATDAMPAPLGSGGRPPQMPGTSGAAPDSSAPEASVEAGPSPDAGPPVNPCAVGLKRCGGLCVSPEPGVGCSLEDCDECPAVAHATVACENEACSVSCEDGYVLSGEACVTDASCENGTQDNAETDVDCGGDLCPNCPLGSACEEDEDCDAGPCEGGTCACAALTCASTITCASEVDDGCGGTLDCSNNCAGSEVCFNDNCCTPATSCPEGVCRSVDDGCGGMLDCANNCAGSEVCHNGACCTPDTACTAGECGQVNDGCGGTTDCSGNCSSGQVCHNGSCCTPDTTCGSGECGPVSNGCGGMTDCGGCPGGTPCMNNQCCVPRSCSGGCGFQNDGCGGNACPLCGSGARCNDNNDCQSGNCRLDILACGLSLRCCQ